MIPSYSLEEVAAAHLPADWVDGVRWLKRRLASGEIPGKQISRGVWRMTDAHIAEWLAQKDSPPVVLADVSVLDGLSPRSQARRSA